jgi:hypothetical protein
MHLHQSDEAYPLRPFPEDRLGTKGGFESQSPIFRNFSGIARDFYD